MADGDWAPGSRATNRLVQIVVDDEGRVRHCGIGFHVVSPNGRVLTTSGGHTWGGHDSQPPQPWLDRLQEMVDELVREADEFEGLTSLSS
jgi:hypothetical protein